MSISPRLSIRACAPFVGLLLLTGCSTGEASKAIASPERGESLARMMDRVRKPFADSAAIDLTTPDRALKSYWRINDLQEAAAYALALVQRAEYARVRAEGGPAYRLDSLQTAVLGGDALAEHIQAPDTTVPKYAREIIEVKQETETRAVVIARVRNVTPVRAGAVVDESDAKSRRDGETYRYVLERDASGWKVVQAMTKYYTGDDWRPYFTPGQYSVPRFVSP